MWIDTVDPDALRTILRHSSALILISTVDGGIVWANQSFCSWSKYSLAELQKLGWKEISTDDSDLAADIAMVNSLDQYNLTYVIQKRYIPKNDKPQLGNLYVTRYPATGPIQFCFCRWDPLVNGTAQAFELALESQSKMTAQMEQLTAQVKTITTQTTEESWLLSTVRLGIKYPKLAALLAVVMLSAFGFDTILNTLQRLGYVSPPPVVIQNESK